MVMVEVVTTVHILLGATSDRSISTLGPGGSLTGAHYFPFTYTVRLTVDQHREETGISTLAISFPTWMLCCRSVTRDGMH